ncbi:hypothetical protein GUJ93_ZPchr0010g10098 [Zizania palustris]|uniref:Uncharacterized protein n=1 Tax=Zizania palustris TaxID=103762 RepID=A0A8J6BND0_ZIZPA|nr:hypothetical protein GUJ93_ZPchr0010g10098 [Zizania palustris]
MSPTEENIIKQVYPKHHNKLDHPVEALPAWEEVLDCRAEKEVGRVDRTTERQPKGGITFNSTRTEMEFDRVAPPNLIAGGARKRGGRAWEKSRAGMGGRGRGRPRRLRSWNSVEALSLRHAAGCCAEREEEATGEVAEERERVAVDGAATGGGEQRRESRVRDGE